MPPIFRNFHNEQMVKHFKSNLIKYRELDYTEPYHQGRLSFIIHPTVALQVSEVKLEYRRHMCHDSTRCEQKAPRISAMVV